LLPEPRAALAGTALPFPFGDLAALGQMLDDHKGQGAAVIMEPLRSEKPTDGSLADIRKLCDEHGVVLIFDEVSSGFRFGMQGAQGYVSVTPDMAVFAKPVSNGYPMAAVVGRRAVMEPAARMFISSTYWSDPIGMVAALTTIRELRRRNGAESLWKFGEELRSRVNRLACEAGLDIACSGLAVHPHLEFRSATPDQTSILTTLFIQEMAKQGSHGYASFYLNAAQGTAELEQSDGGPRGLHDPAPRD
jgi:glutamate-1-semialdehyde aminotransferase